MPRVPVGGNIPTPILTDAARELAMAFLLWLSQGICPLHTGGTRTWEKQLIGGRMCRGSGLQRVYGHRGEEGMAQWL